jgi:hypothetical protein
MRVRKEVFGEEALPLWPLLVVVCLFLGGLGIYESFPFPI